MQQIKYHHVIYGEKLFQTDILSFITKDGYNVTRSGITFLCTQIIAIIQVLQHINSGLGASIPLKYPTKVSH